MSPRRRVFVLGVGALAFGLWPRGAIGVAYGLVVWSFLAEIVASVVGSGHWLRNTSPLLHITPAPAAAPDWTAAAWLVGLGLLAALVGPVAFGRRDLVGPDRAGVDNASSRAQAVRSRRRAPFGSYGASGRIRAVRGSPTTYTVSSGAVSATSRST